MHHAPIAALVAVLSLTPLARSAQTPPSFSSAQSVEAFRVAPRYEKRKATRRIFHDQKIIAGPRRLDAASARALGKELERVYRVDWPPLYCAFVARYGVRLRLSSRTVEVLVCPHCGEVKFYTAPGWLRSSSVSSELFRLLGKVFPDYPLQPDET